MSELADGKEGQTLEKVCEDILECSVCLEGISVTPVYQCHVGHLLCQPCNKKVQFCPICIWREKLGNKRNYAIEKLVEAIHPVVFYCPEYLCGERVSEKKLKEHFQKKSHQFKLSVNLNNQ